MIVKCEKSSNFEGNRSGLPNASSPLTDKMTSQNAQSEASKPQQRRAKEPLPKTQERRAKLRRHPIS